MRVVLSSLALKAVKIDVIRSACVFMRLRTSACVFMRLRTSSCVFVDNWDPSIANNASMHKYHTYHTQRKSTNTATHRQHKRFFMGSSVSHKHIQTQSFLRGSAFFAVGFNSNPFSGPRFHSAAANWTLAIIRVSGRVCARDHLKEHGFVCQ